MIYLDREKDIECIAGTIEDILGELGCISSRIEEKLSETVGVKMAEQLVDGAIQAGREYNREYVYCGNNVSPRSVEEEA